MAEDYGLTEQTEVPIDNLVVPDFPVLVEEGTIESGQVLSRGDVVGKVTATGEYKKSVSTAGDGSEVPDKIMNRDCDASGGAVISDLYIFGSFNKNKIGLDASHTLADIIEGFRQKGIFLLNASVE